MASAAQDEFNRLVASQTPTLSRHPEDGSDDSDDGSTTLASALSPKSSLPSGSLHAKSLKGQKQKTPYDDDYDDDFSDISDYETSARKPSKYYIPHTYNSNANTGPKGVIADALAFEAQKRVGRTAQANAGYGRTKDMVLPKAQRAVRSRDRARRASSDDDDDDDKENAEFQTDLVDDEVAAWRERRREELKSRSRPPQRLGRQAGSGLTYAGLERVDEMGYLEAIERAGRGSIVIVYIFDDGEDEDESNEQNVELSEAYGEHLAHIAKKHPNVRFVALHREVAELDSVVVPAILAYRDGDKVCGMLPLRDEVPFTCNVITNLEDALKGYDVL